MITALLFDFSWVLLFPVDHSYHGELNKLHRDLSPRPDYRFSDNFYLNIKLLDYLDSIKDKVPLYMFTSGTIQNVPEIRRQLDPVFREIYSAEDFTLSKKDPAAYQKIAGLLHRLPEEILFLDDQESNISAARTAGFKTLLFTDTGVCIDYLKALIKELPSGNL